MKVPAPPHEATELLARLAVRYEVIEKDVRVDGTAFRLLKVLDTNRLVDAIAPQEFADDERLPYWAEIWPSSTVLAEACLSRIEVSGKRVLELGCGLGLAGIAAAKAGARVTLSDYERDSLQFSRYNALVNLTEGERAGIRYMMFDWRELPDVEPFDIVLAADCVYERRNFFPLIGVLKRFVKPDGFAVFTEPGRSIGELFFSLLREQGFDVTISLHPAISHGKPIDVLEASIRRSPE